MQETKRITSLFEKLYNGAPWLDINIVLVLESIDAIDAYKKILKNSHTIWEITNHLIDWRINVLQRVNGKIVSAPDHNYFEHIKDNSVEAWKATLTKLETIQNEWITFLTSCNEENLELRYEPNGMTYYEHIQGILQHDCYHLGQIVLLSKQL